MSLIFYSVCVNDLDLVAEKCSRTDTIFFRKNCPDMFQCFLNSLELENNTVENIEAIYTTVALLIVEVACYETLPDFLNFIVRIQVSKNVLFTQFVIAYFLIDFGLYGPC